MSVCLCVVSVVLRNILYHIEHRLALATAGAIQVALSAGFEGVCCNAPLIDLSANLLHRVFVVKAQWA